VLVLGIGDHGAMEFQLKLTRSQATATEGA